MLSKIENTTTINSHLTVGTTLHVTLWEPHRFEETAYLPTDTILQQSELVDYTATVLDINDDCMLLPFPPDDLTHQELFTFGRRVRCVLRSEEAVFVFYPKIKRYSIKGTLGIWMELPPYLDTLFKRKHLRVTESFPVAVMPKHSTAFPTFVTESLDISAGGMRFTSPYMMESGQGLQLHFKLGHVHQQFVINAKVVYLLNKAEPFGTHRLAVPTNAVSYTAAVQFLDLEPIQESELLQTILEIDLLQHVMESRESTPATSSILIEGRLPN